MRTQMLCFAFVCLMASGCGDNTMTAATLDLAQAAALPDLTVPTTSAQGVITDDGATIAPLMGAMVCPYPSHTPCVSTDATGMFNLSGLPLSGAAFTIEKAGFYTGLWTFPPSTGAPYAISPQLVATSGDRYLTASGKTQDSSKGFITVFVHDGNGAQLTGATLALSPSAGDGPIYFDATVTPPKVLTSTGHGFIFFMNVPAASYTVTATAAGKTCNSTLGVLSGANAATVPVVAGDRTAIGFVCQ